MLGPGDLLQINVFGVSDFDRKVRVMRDGTISLPLLGAIPLAGLTVEQGGRAIARLLAERRIVNDPNVSIFVEEFVSNTVSVQGAVVKPGIYPLTGRNTLLDVLGAAGGLSDRRGTDIVVLRADPNAVPRSIDIDADRLSAGADAALNITLHAGDILMVPQAREFRVYVTGAVFKPGAVDYLSSEGITVLQAITAAGGPTPRANLGNVHVIRKKADGSQTRIKVSIKRIQAGKQDDLVLQRNDTVVVGEWFF